MFNIIKQDPSKEIAYEVGYYKLEAFPNEGEPFEAAGKFVTVLQRNNQRKWQIVVDAFNDFPLLLT